MGQPHSTRTITDLRPGDHLCCLYETEEEHRAVFTPFLRQGLERGEKVLYLVDVHDTTTILDYLRDDALKVEPYVASGQLAILTCDDAAGREGVFEPDEMIDRLGVETEQALAEGYSALRVSREMTWALRGLPGSERLIEYEAKLNEFLHGSQCLAICQYDRRRFDPAVLLDVLSTHPLAIVGIEVYDNFFYAPPSELLGRDLSAAELDRRVQNLIERKQAEAALEESEERFRKMFDSSHDLLTVADKSGQTLWANAAWQRTLGYTPETQGNPLDKVHPDDLALVTEAWQAVWDDATAFVDIQYRYRIASGEYVHLETTTHRHVVAGKPVLYVAARDVTERVRAEEALRDSAERYRAIFEQAAGSIVLIDPKTGALVEFNDMAHEKLGYTREEFSELTIADLDVFESLEEVVGYAEKIIEQGSDRLETQKRTKSGEVRDYQVNARAVTIRGEEFVQALWYDITDRKRMEAALRRTLDATLRIQRMLLALSEAAQAVQRARTTEEVYRMVGDEVVRLGYHCLIFTLVDDGAHLAIAHQTLAPDVLRAAQKLTGLSLETFRIPLAQAPVFQRALTEGEASFHEPSADHIARGLPKRLRPLAGRLVALMGLEQSITAPLKVRGEMHGLLMVTGTGLTEGDMPAVTAFANQTGIALDNARLLDELSTHARDLRRLSALITNTQENERKRLSREMHDELGQGLTAISLNLAEVERGLPPDCGPKVRETLAETCSLADTTLDQVREIALDLRPSILDDLGLVAVLRWHTNRFARRHDIEVELEAIDLEARLDPDIETALYRIVQEALTNVARHAQATRVRVRLERGPSSVMTLIEDDGQGFDPEEVAVHAAPGRGLGLLGMRERVALL
jgi:PAS domain S-box-containing protein